MDQLLVVVSTAQNVTPVSGGHEPVGMEVSRLSAPLFDVRVGPTRSSSNILNISGNSVLKSFVGGQSSTGRSELIERRYEGRAHF